MNEFQRKLKTDSEMMRKSDKVFIPADKTTNFYKVDKEKHDDLLKKHVTKDYKKTVPETSDKINLGDCNQAGFGV